jgi:hypothetical protein
VQRVLPGTALSFTVTPDNGYAVRSVFGCGGSLDDSTYTTGPINRACMVRATFK